MYFLFHILLSLLQTYLQSKFTRYSSPAFFNALMCFCLSFSSFFIADFVSSVPSDEWVGRPASLSPSLYLEYFPTCSGTSLKKSSGLIFILASFASLSAFCLACRSPRAFVSSSDLSFFPTSSFKLTVRLKMRSPDFAELSKVELESTTKNPKRSNCRAGLECH